MEFLHRYGNKLKAISATFCCSKIGIHNKGTSKKLASARVQAGPGYKEWALHGRGASCVHYSPPRGGWGLPKVRGGKCLAHTQRCIEFLDETALPLHIMVMNFVSILFSEYLYVSYRFLLKFRHVLQGFASVTAYFVWYIGIWILEVEQSNDNFEFCWTVKFIGSIYTLN